MDRQISVPIKKEDAVSLRAGDYVTLTGTIYTARDAAHKRMQETLDAGEALPIEMQGNVIYYMGPSPAREGRPIGSAGPTTASRMDKYAPKLLDLGLGAMIGKGKRSQAVINQRELDIIGSRMSQDAFEPTIARMEKGEYITEGIATTFIKFSEIDKVFHLMDHPDESAKKMVILFD